MVEKESMIYKNLGKSGLKVSAISLGNWLTGHNLEFEETQYQCFSKAIEAGVNFLDTAEIYGFGNAETELGNILKKGEWNRDELVISTKFIKAGTKLSQTGLGRKRLIQGVRNSLKRLQLDYADIIFLHRPDQDVPIVETVRTVNHLIETGKADYWGTSEFTPAELMEVFEVCEKYGFVEPVAEQCQYSMMWRKRVEVELAPLFDHYGMGTTVWSPLMGGILTGKYNQGIPDGTRVSDPMLPAFVKQRYEEPFLPENKETTLKKLQELGKVAEDLGCTQAQLAIAWCMKSPDVSTAITGATRPQQIEDTIKSVEVVEKLTPEVLNRIEEILQTRPTPPMNWRTWELMPHRR